jgi:hypothetical protein
LFFDKNIDDVEENKIQVREITYILIVKNALLVRNLYIILHAEMKNRIIAFRKKITDKISIEKEKANNLLLLKDEEVEKDFISLYNHPILKRACQQYRIKNITDYDMEEMLADNGIRLWAPRKSNSKRLHNPCREYLISRQRKRVETAFSVIAKLLPKTIHAVTAEGFIIKLIAWLILLIVSCIYK